MQTEKKLKLLDAIEFSFSVVGLPHFVARYFAKSGDSIETGAIRHGLRKLVEYQPGNDSSAGFQPGVNTIVQERLFWGTGSGSKWGALTVSESTDSTTGATVYSICSTNDISVTVCAFGVDIWSELTVNGSKFAVDPNSIHHLFNISNFPWKGTNTQLALKTHFEAVSQVVPINETTLLNSGEAGFNLSDSSDGSVTPAASWNTTVSVTGTGCSATAPVVRSVIYSSDVAADEDVNINTATNQWSGEVNLKLITRIVYFSFLTDCNQPTDILWDPDMGFVDSGSFASVIFPSLSLLLLALFSLLF